MLMGKESDGILIVKNASRKQEKRVARTILNIKNGYH